MTDGTPVTEKSDHPKAATSAYEREVRLLQRDHRVPVGVGGAGPPGPPALDPGGGRAGAGQGHRRAVPDRLGDQDFHRRAGDAGPRRRPARPGRHGRPAPGRAAPWRPDYPAAAVTQLRPRPRAVRRRVGHPGRTGQRQAARRPDAHRVGAADFAPFPLLQPRLRDPRPPGGPARRQHLGRNWSSTG